MDIKATYQAKVWVSLTLTFESTQPRAAGNCPAMWTRFEIHEYGIRTSETQINGPHITNSSLILFSSPEISLPPTPHQPQCSPASKNSTSLSRRMSQSTASELVLVHLSSSSTVSRKHITYGIVSHPSSPLPLQSSALT
jgi:hypothetical protein